jgi:hypothetical protein
MGRSHFGRNRAPKLIVKLVVADKGNFVNKNFCIALCKARLRNDGFDIESVRYQRPSAQKNLGAKPAGGCAKTGQIRPENGDISSWKQS